MKINSTNLISYEDPNIGKFNSFLFVNNDSLDNDISVIMTNYESFEMTKMSLESIFHFKNDCSFNVFLVDNFSSKETKDKLKNLCKSFKVNFVSNESVSYPDRNISMFSGINGSYLNAVGFNTGVAFSKDFNPISLFICHNDIFFCKSHSLDFLFKKLDPLNDIVGVATNCDLIRVNAMHMSGYLIDWNFYKEKNPNWFPKWNDQNEMIWDVGDHATVAIRESNKKYFICNNTRNNPNIEQIVNKNNLVYQKNISSDKAFDDSNEIFFLHIGRGLLRASNLYNKPNKTLYNDWIEFGKQYLRENSV